MLRYLQIAIVALIITACGEGRMSPQGGTVTGVTAGDGVTGGGVGGAVTVNVVPTTGGGLTVAADSVGMTLCAGNQIPQMNVGGTAWTCATINLTTETVISPAAITGLQTDYNPPGAATATVIRVAATGTVEITGIANEADGRKYKICNASAQTIILYHENANTTTLARRLQLNNGVGWTLPAGANTCLHLVYSSGAARWIQVAQSGRFFPGLDVAGDISQTSGSITTSGNATVNGNATVGDSQTLDTHTINGKLTHGVTAQADAWYTTLTSSGFVGSPHAGTFLSTGTVDAGLAVRESYGVYANAITTRSAGTNALTNYGVVANASGAQVNVGVYSTGTDFSFYGATGALFQSGTAQVNGNSTLGDSGDSTTVNGNAIVQNPAGVSAVSVLNTAAQSTGWRAMSVTPAGTAGATGSTSYGVYVDHTTTCTGLDCAHTRYALWTQTGLVNFEGATRVGNTFDATGNVKLGSATTNAHEVKGNTIFTETVGVTLAGIESNTNLLIADDTAFAAGVGGAATFFGKYNAAGASSSGGGIKLMKTNATDGDFGFDMAFGTRPNGGSITERMRLSSTGAVTIPGTLGVTGAATMSSTLAVTGNTTLSGLVGVRVVPAASIALYVDGSALTYGVYTAQSTAGRTITTIGTAGIGAGSVNTGADLTVETFGAYGEVTTTESAGTGTVYNIGVRGSVTAGDSTVGVQGFGQSAVTTATNKGVVGTCNGGSLCYGGEFTAGGGGSQNYAVKATTSGANNYTFVGDGGTLYNNGPLQINGGSTLGSAGAGTLTTINNIVQVQEFRDTVITPAALAATENNYAPVGIATAGVIKVSSTTTINITGLTGGTEGRRMTIYNNGAQVIYLPHEHLDSVATNRFFSAWGDRAFLEANNSVELVYTNSRWQIYSKSGRFQQSAYFEGTLVGYSTFAVYGTSNTIGDAATDMLNVTATLGFSGPDVTVSACGTATVNGEAQSFQITTDAVTPCVVAFNRTFGKAPFCTFSAADGRAAAGIANTSGAAAAPFITSTTTTVSLNFAVAGAGIYNITCFDRF